MAIALKPCNDFAAIVSHPIGLDPRPIPHLRSVEARDWLDPTTGRTELGSVAVETFDRDAADELTVGREVWLAIEWDGQSRDFGQVRVSFNVPKLAIREAPLYRVVFEPVGRR